MKKIKTGESRFMPNCMRWMLSGAVLVCLIVSARGEGGIWYVKAANYGKTGLDGLTEETAWGDLQTAHDKAAAGDTIKVLEGVYDKGGGKVGNVHKNRLVVEKQLTFEAVDGADKTHIVGQLANTPNGYKGDGMRCVAVLAAGKGTIFKNFTFRNGSTGNGTKRPYDYNGITITSGGAISCAGGLGANSWETAYFVDCVISGNAGQWGAAMSGGTAIRCLIVNNLGSGYGGICFSAALVNSIVIGVKQVTNARSVVGTCSYIVNSLIASFTDLGCADETGFASKCYNTLFTSNGSTAMRSGPQYGNCAITSLGVYSPATFDFRLIAGTEGHGKGNTSYLAEAWDLLKIPEEIEMKDFNGNPIDLTKETCDIGAVQGAVEGACGAVSLPLGTIVDGKEVPRYKTTYARPAEWPKALVLTPSTANFYSYKASGDVLGGLAHRFLQPDGTCHIMPPPSANQVITLAESTYLHEYWCNPNANAADAEGTEASPFRTVQDAIIAATNTMTVADESGPVVINLLPGDYREGSDEMYGHKNRIAIPDNSQFLIRSTEGAAVTRVYGAADQNSTDSSFAGCGSEAMRCAAIGDGTGSAFQGITFADGHSDFADDAVEADSSRAGGVYAGSGQVLDCVITNCTAVWGGGAYSGNFQRCKFYDCVSYGGVVVSATIASCYVDASCRNGEGGESAAFEKKSVIGSGVKAVLCTAPVAYADADSVYSMMFGDQDVYNKVQWGSVFRSATSVADESTGYAVKDCGFVDFANGDLRLVTGTPAADVSAGAIGARNSASWTKWASSITAFAQSDIGGNRLKLIGGKLMPGCYHTTVDGFYVSASKGGVAVNGSVQNKLMFADNLPATVTPIAGNRPCIGVVVNGVTNKFDDGIVFSASDLEQNGGSIYAEAVYTTDWYVDPEGDDANCGFTPKTAKRLLASAMAMTLSGDTVHAAEGRYEEGVGSAKYASNHPDSRIYIPSGRTLVADGAVDKTFIVGELGDDEFTNALGCGSNSVRCVYMAKNSKIKGFTLTGGSAYPLDANAAEKDYTRPFNGGAVFGVDRESCIIQDCIISNCAAYNGAAARDVAFVNCRIFENRANRGITSECYHFGSIIDRNYADAGAVFKHTRVIDTTIGPNAWSLNGAAGIGLGQRSSTSSRISNSMILSKCSAGAMAITVSNCVFVTGVGSSQDILNNSYNTHFVSEDQLKVDENLRPIAGKNFACDIADASIALPNATLTKLVTELRKRANNGNRLDAGALEADWSCRYAKDVGDRHFAVSFADKAVEETPVRTVLVPAGAKIAGEWTNDSGNVRTYRVRFVVPEGGEAEVTANGEVKAFGRGSHEYSVSSAAENLAFEFASNSGTAEILDGGWVRGAMMVIR